MPNTKEYMKKYYAENKERISAKLSKKVTCEFCGKTVIHQNYMEHLQSTVCIKKRLLGNITNLLPIQSNDKLDERPNDKVDETLNDKVDEKPNDKVDEKTLKIIIKINNVKQKLQKLIDKQTKLNKNKCD